MTVQHVEINQIHKSKAVKITVSQFHGHFQALRIAGGADGFAHTLASENIVDLANADGGFTSLLQNIQHGICGRHQAEIMAARGAGEVGGTIPDKGTGNHAANAVFANQHAAGFGTDFIQLFYRDDRLVGGNLEHAVCGGVYDQCAGFHMFLTIVFDDFGAGVRLVAQYLIPGAGGKLIQNFFRESIRESWQWLRAEQTGNLPVTDGGIFPGAGFPQAGIAADRGIQLCATGYTVQIKHAKAGQLVPLEIGVSGNSAQSVGTGIAKSRGIRLGTNAKAVKND